MDEKTFAMYFAVTFLIILSPGPAVFLAVSQGTQYGIRGGMLAAVGIESINACYYLISALGLTVLLLAQPLLFQVLRWTGIAYLLFNGVRLLVGSRKLTLTANPQTSNKRLIAQGMMTQLANPKALIYFSAMLPQFVNAAKPVGPQFTILAATGCVTEFIVLTAYGWIAHHGSKFLPGPTAILWQNRIAGVCLTAVGVILVLT